MKRIIKIVVLALIVLSSCKKADAPKECKCGVIVEMYYRTLTPNNENGLIKIDISTSYKVKVKNNCSGKIKKFNYNSDSYFEGQEFCSEKSW